MSKGKRIRSGGAAKKKPYRAPALTVHGDLRSLTRAKGGTRSDSGGRPKTKTTGVA